VLCLVILYFLIFLTDKKDVNANKKTTNEDKKKDEKKEAVETIKTVHVPIERNPKIEVSFTLHHGNMEQSCV
jgi:hypothetical protein